MPKPVADRVAFKAAIRDLATLIRGPRGPFGVSARELENAILKVIQDKVLDSQRDVRTSNLNPADLRRLESLCEAIQLFEE